MNEFVDRLAGPLVNADEAVAREFEARLADSSALAFRVAFSVLRHRQDAEDVAQDAFARAHRKFADLRDRDRFRAWLVRMTWRLALDYRRGERRRLAREAFVLRGETLRAIEVRVEDPDVVDRLGIDHYYEVDVFTEDSQNHPLVCCVAELPPGMPRGENIRENVDVRGFFLKSWAYGAQSPSAEAATSEARERQLLAPLLIAKTLRWTPSNGRNLPGASVGVAIAAAVVASIVALWFVARGARRAPWSARHARDTLPETISLDASKTNPARSTISLT